MNHQLITTLLWLGYYTAFAVWLLLIVLLIISLLRKRWGTVKRASKFLINSVVFLFAYAFYLDMALIVRPPVSASQLKTWVNSHVLNYLYISVISIIVLLFVNYLFYKRLEKQRHRSDLFILAMLDVMILLCGAWLSGQDAYYGLLQELNR
jgi:hypothetical protein